MTEHLAIRDDDKLERRLKPMYEAIVDIWPDKENAPPLPSLESCVLAHRYQESWAPSMQEDDGVNLLVLGESHLSTDSSLLGTQIDATEHPEFALPTLGHINLVHCPSYGELALLPESFRETMSSSNRNTVKTGTWQFWRVLSVLSGFTDFDPANCDVDVLESTTPLRTVFSSLHKTNSSLQQRLATKAEILHRLRQRRIMFADVCPAPIAVGGNNCMKVLNKETGTYYTTKRVSLNDASKSAIIRTAWNKYSSHLVRKYKPRYVLVLGRSVLSSIGVDALEESLVSHGGLLLGSMYHPSCNHAKSEACSRVMMKYLRQVALVACENPDKAHRLPCIEMASKTILQIFNATSNKKMIQEKASGLVSKKSCKPDRTLSETSVHIVPGAKSDQKMIEEKASGPVSNQSCKQDRILSEMSAQNVSCASSDEKMIKEKASGPASKTSFKQDKILSETSARILSRATSDERLITEKASGPASNESFKQDVILTELSVHKVPCATSDQDLKEKASGPGLNKSCKPDSMRLKTSVRRPASRKADRKMMKEKPSGPASKKRCKQGINPSTHYCAPMEVRQKKKRKHDALILRDSSENNVIGREQ
ncbi:hypothetical protein MHU86_1032 [Fragilaria crotonensis]|nr:hypothetical protein MHU86_1032 [Fragilaria crotonensis]